MANYELCAAWVRQHARPEAKVLDYGCGRGEVMKLMRPDLDAFWCDVFVVFQADFFVLAIWVLRRSCRPR